MMRSRTFKAGVLVTLGVSLLATTLLVRKSLVHESALRVETATVSRGTIEDWERLPARVIYLRSERLAFEHAGMPEKVLVSEGDKVLAGDLLAQQATSPEERRNAGAEAAAVTVARRAKEIAERAETLAGSLYEAGAESRQAWADKQLSAESTAVELEGRLRALASSRADDRRSQIRASFSGRVAEINLRDSANTGSTSGILLTSPRTDGIASTVDDVTASRLTIGQPALYQAGTPGEPALEGTGVVLKISELPAPPTYSQSSAGLEVRISMAPADIGKLRVNQPIKLRMLVARHERAVLVPTAAIVGHDGEQFVLVIHAGIVNWRKVGVGIEQGDLTEILTPNLTVGETLVIPSSGAPRDGQAVVASPRR
jgi:RND family efflux transporter MFP subunit